MTAFIATCRDDRDGTPVVINKANIVAASPCFSYDRRTGSYNWLTKIWLSGTEDSRIKSLTILMPCAELAAALGVSDTGYIERFEAGPT
jgi:hypothetical protein